MFMHGNPGSSRDWLDLINAIEPFAHAFAPDMPGFGRADKPGTLTTPLVVMRGTSAECWPAAPPGQPREMLIYSLPGRRHNPAMR